VQWVDFLLYIRCNSSVVDGYTVACSLTFIYVRCYSLRFLAFQGSNGLYGMDIAHGLIIASYYLPSAVER
jgi:hypothetical protein